MLKLIMNDNAKHDFRKHVSSGQNFNTRLLV